VTKVSNNLPLTRHVSVNSTASFRKTTQKRYTPLLKCLYIKIIIIPCNYVKEVPSIWLSSFQTCFQCLGLHCYNWSWSRYNQATQLTFSTPAPSIYTALLQVSPSMFGQVEWNICKQGTVIRPIFQMLTGRKWENKLSFILYLKHHRLSWSHPGVVGSETPMGRSWVEGPGKGAPAQECTVLPVED
jgi:hypothetical protein